MDKVILSTGHVAFGGSRIRAGVASVDLWNDGVVIGAAWSMMQPEIEGHIFSFRGTLRRSAPWMPRSAAWRLVDTEGTFVSTYATRAEALEGVTRMVTLDAFRELNRVEAAR